MSFADEVSLDALLGPDSPIPARRPGSGKPVVSRLWFPGAQQDSETGLWHRDLLPVSGGVDQKISALTAAASALGTQEVPVNESGVTKKVTMSQIRQYVGSGLSNGSTANQTGFASDTYLANSAITIPVAGGWKVSTQVRWTFDMVKTAAGTAAFTVIVRLGTLGTTGDAAQVTLAFAAGTAAVDSGIFEVIAIFRSVGSGTAAVIQGVITCAHALAATGLISTGASGYGQIAAVSSGFNSTTQTIIGLSANGGASFSGTNVIVRAVADNI